MHFKDFQWTSGNSKKHSEFKKVSAWRVKASFWWNQRIEMVELDFNTFQSVSVGYRDVSERLRVVSVSFQKSSRRLKTSFWELQKVSKGF